MKRGYVYDVERCGIRESFEELGGTLNGVKAVIVGRKLEYPSVVAMDGSGMSAEFSWNALRRRIKTGRVHIKT